MNEETIDNIIERLIPIGLSIARKDEGALFVISDDCEYERLIPQNIEDFNVFDSGAEKILEQIAKIDGAIIISKKGLVKDYAAKIKANRIWEGKGTRHSAAISASYYHDTTVLLVSQEEKKLKILKQGKLILQIDALEKDVEKNYRKTMDLLESIGIGTVTSLASVIVTSSTQISQIPIVGLLSLSGIVIGSSFYLFKKLS